MMRYQRGSPDCLPLTNGRKPNLRAFLKEEDADCVRISNFNIFEVKNQRSNPGSTPSTSQESDFSQFLVSDSLQPENTPGRSHINHESSIGTGGDILLQWGKKKRPRGSRADNRAVKDGTSQAKHPVKIHRRPVPGFEKRSISAAMSPPSVVFSHPRTANQRSTVAVRETMKGSSHCRNLDERSARRNVPQLATGNSSLHPQSSVKESPWSPEKMDNKLSCSSAVAGKQKGKAGQAEPIILESVAPQAEQEPGMTAKKLNLDLFEWPRIYISLSRKEKEDDFLAIKGTKLPQRPKKRAKNVDKTLQCCFPGMWLSDITKNRYEVREKKCMKKRRRGLKDMESMDSDSD